MKIQTQLFETSCEQTNRQRRKQYPRQKWRRYKTHFSVGLAIRRSASKTRRTWLVRLVSDVRDSTDRKQTRKNRYKDRRFGPPTGECERLHSTQRQNKIMLNVDISSSSSSSFISLSNFNITMRYGVTLKN